jgi:hypothetical protein
VSLLVAFPPKAPKLQAALTELQAAAAAAGAAAAEAQELFFKERAVRRKLHEQLQVGHGAGLLKPLSFPVAQSVLSPHDAPS